MYREIFSAPSTLKFDENELLDLHPNFMWMTFGKAKQFIRFNNYFNIITIKNSKLVCLAKASNYCKLVCLALALRQQVGFYYILMLIEVEEMLSKEQQDGIGELSGKETKVLTVGWHPKVEPVTFFGK